MSLDTDYDINDADIFEETANEIDALFDKIRGMTEKQRKEQIARVKAETNQDLLARQRKIRNDLMGDRGLSAQLGIDRTVYAEPRQREYDIWNIAAYELARREMPIDDKDLPF